MANTGRKIMNVLSYNGTPYTIDLNATAEDIVIQTGGVMTVAQAQNLIDSRIIENSADCTPFCLPVLVTDEVPVEAVIDNNIGISFHAIIDSTETCVTAILTI